MILDDLFDLGWLDKMIFAKSLERDRLRLMICSVSGCEWKDAVKKSLYVDHIGDGISKILEAEKLVEQAIERWDKCKKRVMEVLEKITDKEMQLVLTLRYIDQLPWSKVAKSMQYTQRHVYRVHNEAVQCFVDQAKRLGYE